MTRNRFFIYALTLFSVHAMYGQARFKVPITLRSGSIVQTLQIGVHGDGPGGTLQDNTTGVDFDSTFGDYREVSLPPAPPPPYAFDARLVTVPGRSATFPTGLGAGVATDYRGFTNAAQVDSFKILISGENLDSNATTISWPSNLGLFGTSWTLKPQAGTEWPTTNMLTSTSLVLPAQVSERRIIIIKVGASGVTSVRQTNDKVPGVFSLSQNHPNPFNPSTEIRFGVPIASEVSLTVYNLLGQEVVSLVNEFKSAGSYSVQFNAAHLASGMYLYRLNARGFSEVKKLVLLK